jgi:hypothetical protein
MKSDFLYFFEGLPGKLAEALSNMTEIRWQGTIHLAFLTAESAEEPGKNRFNALNQLFSYFHGILLDLSLKIGCWDFGRKKISFNPNSGRSITVKLYFRRAAHNLTPLTV